MPPLVAVTKTEVAVNIEHRKNIYLEWYFRVYGNFFLSVLFLLILSPPPLAAISLPWHDGSDNTSAHQFQLCHIHMALSVIHISRILLFRAVSKVGWWRLLLTCACSDNISRIKQPEQIYLTFLDSVSVFSHSALLAPQPNADVGVHVSSHWFGSSFNRNDKCHGWTWTSAHFKIRMKYLFGRSNGWWMPANELINRRRTPSTSNDFILHVFSTKKISATPVPKDSCASGWQWWNTTQNGKKERHDIQKFRSMNGNRVFF